MMAMLRKRAPTGRRSAWVIGSLAAVLISSSGCLTGAIYTHTTVPLDVNLEDTPQKPERRGGSWKTIMIPLYYVNPQFDWGSTGVGDAVERAGIETVYYADLETLSVLGVWTQRTIHVYGE
jgi:hypothetical protein